MEKATEPCGTLQENPRGRSSTAFCKLEFHKIDTAHIKNWLTDRSQNSVTNKEISEVGLSHRKVLIKNSDILKDFSNFFF